ncbi:MAG: class I SAM-dependent methyltransferase [Rhizobium sp.]|nr:class I SAM-dependent methyltransferase [Rhizobium sp.]
MLNISPTSSGNTFRLKRVKLLGRMIDDVVRRKGSCQIIDLGGTAQFWQTWQSRLDLAHTTVDCINITDQFSTELSDLPAVRTRIGDACSLLMFEDNAFDIVFSNSVIEHVGSWARKRAFAAEVRRLAPSYAIQTPSFSFPIEPHARLPFIHWLPDPIRYRAHLKMRTGFYPKARSLDEAMNALEDATLLDRRQMQHLFPDALVHTETFLGFAKSFTAIRHAATDAAVNQTSKTKTVLPA